MKALKILILPFLTISTYGLILWVIVEFLIYLFKDQPFNWLSFWLAIVSIVLLLAAFFLNAIIAGIKEAIEEEKLKEERKNRPISKFEQRLEEAKKQRKLKIK